MINIVSFNGGRGARNLIPTLLDIDGVNLTCIVNAYDDGKSTGEIRSYFNMLGPSDIRKVQEAMVPKDHIDYDAIIKAYEFRYDINANADDVLNDLSAFAEGLKNDIAGIVFKDEQTATSLRVLVKRLLVGINLIEKAENKKLSFSDCSVMNLIYAGAFLYFGGNFEDATVFIDKLFKLKGTVLPTNNEDKKLVAIREDGTILYSEAEIVELRSNSRIKKIYLLDQYPDRSKIAQMSLDEVESYFEIMNRQVIVTPKVTDSIRNADIIIYSPGTQHSSLYPSYITKGITDAIVNNKRALKIFITNIGEDYETPSYTASDYLNGAIRYLRLGTEYNVAVSDIISYAFVNKRFSNNLENYVKYDKDELKEIGCNIIIDDFENDKNWGKHDGELLASRIIDLYNSLFNLKMVNETSIV